MIPRATLIQTGVCYVFLTLIALFPKTSESADYVEGKVIIRRVKGAILALEMVYDILQPSGFWKWSKTSGGACPRGPVLL